MIWIQVTETVQSVWQFSMFETFLLFMIPFAVVVSRTPIKSMTRKRSKKFKAEDESSQPRPWTDK